MYSYIHQICSTRSAIKIKPCLPEIHCCTLWRGIILFDAVDQARKMSRRL